MSRPLAKIIAMAFLMSLMPVNALAASDQDIDRLTSYAVLMGRGIACGAPNAEDAMGKIGAWMDRVFSNNEKAIYISIFTEGVRYHAQMQKDGRSPDPCSAVLSQFAQVRWP